MEEDEVDVTCLMHGKMRNAYMEGVGLWGDIVCELRCENVDWSEDLK